MNEPDEAFVNPYGNPCLEIPDPGLSPAGRASLWRLRPPGAAEWDEAGLLCLGHFAAADGSLVAAYLTGPEAVFDVWAGRRADVHVSGPAGGTYPGLRFPSRQAGPLPDGLACLENARFARGASPPDVMRAVGNVARAVVAGRTRGTAGPRAPGGPPSAWFFRQAGPGQYGPAGLLCDGYTYQDGVLTARRLRGPAPLIKALSGTDVDVLVKEEGKPGPTFLAVRFPGGHGRESVVHDAVFLPAGREQSAADKIKEVLAMPLAAFDHVPAPPFGQGWWSWSPGLTGPAGDPTQGPPGPDVRRALSDNSLKDLQACDGQFVTAREVFFGPAIEAPRALSVDELSDQDKEDFLRGARPPAAEAAVPGPGGAASAAHAAQRLRALPGHERVARLVALKRSDRALYELVKHELARE